MSAVPVNLVPQLAPRRGRDVYKRQGVDVRDGRLRGVSTTAGRVEADAMVLCAGIWGPVVGRMAGVDLPLQPMALSLIHI